MRNGNGLNAIKRLPNELFPVGHKVELCIVHALEAPALLIEVVVSGSDRRLRTLEVEPKSTRMLHYFIELNRRDFYEDPEDEDYDFGFELTDLPLLREMMIKWGQRTFHVLAKDLEKPQALNDKEVENLRQLSVPSQTINKMTLRRRHMRKIKPDFEFLIARERDVDDLIKAGVEAELKKREADRQQLVIFNASNVEVASEGHESSSEEEEEESSEEEEDEEESNYAFELVQEPAPPTPQPIIEVQTPVTALAPTINWIPCYYERVDRLADISNSSTISVGQALQNATWQSDNQADQMHNSTQSNSDCSQNQSQLQMIPIQPVVYGWLETALTDDCCCCRQQCQQQHALRSRQQQSAGEENQNQSLLNTFHPNCGYDYYCPYLPVDQIVRSDNIAPECQSGSRAQQTIDEHNYSVRYHN